VPVVLCDRRVTSENFLTFVNASDMAIGRITAQWLAEKMNYQANVVMLPGAAGASPAIRRLQAAQEVFAQYPGITILDTQYTGWSPATGKTIMAAELSKYGHKINAVWSDHGLQGSGAQEAFLDAGWKDGTIPPMTGADMNIQLQFAIQHKEPVFWVDNPPIVVGKALEVAVEYVLKGIPVPHDYEINTQLVVTKGDVTPSTVYYDYLAQDFYRPQGGPNLVISVDIPNYNPSTFHNPWR